MKMMPLSVTIYNKDEYLTKKGNQLFALRCAQTSLDLNLTQLHMPSLHGGPGMNKHYYLGWVRDWKDMYARLTQRIQFLKTLRKKSTYDKLSNVFKLPNFEGNVYVKDEGWITSYSTELTESLNVLSDIAKIMLAQRHMMRKLNYITWRSELVGTT